MNAVTLTYEKRMCLSTEKSQWVVKRFWNKVILEIIQFRYLYLLPSRHNNVVTISRNVATDIALKLLHSCDGRVRRRCQNDVVTTSYYDVSLLDVATTPFLQHCLTFPLQLYGDVGATL